MASDILSYNVVQDHEGISIKARGRSRDIAVSDAPVHRTKTARGVAV